ncbi:MAG TPA: hypothetical protein VEJ45_12180 [Candidatus Acidoferrales bacterium]|nr:hypothetical protein [Candidatus Acidoferrales bacterium]
MRPKVFFAFLILTLSARAATAQAKPQTITAGQLYCSGIVTNEPVPRDTYIITGQQSNYRLSFNEGEYVYINKGSSEGVKVGDEFLDVRPVEDSDPVDWTKWQTAILHKMGTVWEDESRLKVVVVQANVSIAQVVHSCTYVQRGDIVLPFKERPTPTLKSEANFDQFAPANGKPLAMVIEGKKFQQLLGRNDIMYVNLGASQGVKVGDYFRIFRYEGTEHETAYQTPRFAFDVDGFLGPTLGFGESPKKWNWSNVPREDIGEGVVLRTGPNSSTVLITFSLIEIYPGDYVELE